MLVGCRAFFGSPNGARSDTLRKAEELTESGKFDEAIASYRKHISDRLAEPTRGEWENPYFYLLMIADVELKRSQPAAALVALKEAEDHEVDERLILDRYRVVAGWYEEHQRFDEAFALLTKYRERDPVLFDAMLDRVSRAMVAAEDQPLTPSNTSKSPIQTSPSP